jgi:hypothetical protein
VAISELRDRTNNTRVQDRLDRCAACVYPEVTPDKLPVSVNTDTITSRSKYYIGTAMVAGIVDTYRRFCRGEASPENMEESTRELERFVALGWGGMEVHEHKPGCFTLIPKGTKIVQNDPHSEMERELREESSMGVVPAMEGSDGDHQETE